MFPDTDTFSEGRGPKHEDTHSASRISPQSVEIHQPRPSPTCPPPPSHPRYRQRSSHAPLCWLNNRIFIPLQRRRCMGTIRRPLPPRTSRTNRNPYNLSYSSPNNLQPLPLLALKPLTRITGSHKESSRTCISPPEYFRLGRPPNSHKESVDRTQ